MVKKYQESLNCLLCQRTGHLGVLGIRSYFFTYFFFMCSCCVYMYLEQDSLVLEQLKMSISRYTYFYIMYLRNSPIYFTLPRGGSSPPLVQLEEMIPTSSTFILYQNVALYKPFTLPAKICNKTREVRVCPVTINCQRNFDMPGKKQPRSRYSKKRKGFLCRKKRKKINWR